MCLNSILLDLTSILLDKYHTFLNAFVRTGCPFKVIADLLLFSLDILGGGSAVVYLFQIMALISGNDIYFNIFNLQSNVFL